MHLDTGKTACTSSKRASEREKKGAGNDFERGGRGCWWVGGFHKLSQPKLIPKGCKKRKYAGLVHVRGQRSEWGRPCEGNRSSTTQKTTIVTFPVYKYFVTLLKLIYLYFTWVLFFWQLLTFTSYICTQISVLVKTCLLLFMCLKVSKNIYSVKGYSLIITVVVA